MTSPFEEGDEHTEYAAFHRQLPRLLSTHLNRFVAIRGGQLIDDDDDELRLLERVSYKQSGEFILIQKVTTAELAKIWLD